MEQKKERRRRIPRRDQRKAQVVGEHKREEEDCE
jgi:hypothetical protein